MGATTALGQTTNNFLSHTEARQREAARQQLMNCTDEACRKEAQQTINRLDELDRWRDAQIANACKTPSGDLCQSW